MKKILVLLITLMAVLGIYPTQAFAQYNPTCPSVYGAKCPTGNIFIDKKIKNPQTGEFVDTLNPNQITMLPGQEVTFRIEVKNIGSADMQNIQVQDKFPDYLDYVSGTGNFDKNNKILSWTVDYLKPGEFKLFEIKGKVADASTLPQTGMTCITNFAQAQVDQQVAQDTAVVCIQSKVLSTTQELPKTGPESDLLLYGSASLMGLSLVLFKKAKMLREEVK